MRRLPIAAVVAAVSTTVLAQIASAAELTPAQKAAVYKAPVYKAPPPPPAPVYNWTGFYVGGNVGYSWGNAHTDIAGRASTFALETPGLIVPPDLPGFPANVAFADSNTDRLNGVIGGGQIGYNWQTGRWVLGLETDFQATGQQGTGTFLCGAPCGAPPVSETVTDKLPWFGTVRGRVGYTVTPTVLLYGTGGLGYGDVESSGTGATSFSSSTWKYGWVAGGGIETRIVGNWTAKLEYLYYSDVALQGCQALACLPALPISASGNSPGFTDNIVRAGFNYIFR